MDNWISAIKICKNIKKFMYFLCIVSTAFVDEINQMVLIFLAIFFITYQQNKWLINFYHYYTFVHTGYRTKHILKLYHITHIPKPISFMMFWHTWLSI